MIMITVEIETDDTPAFDVISQCEVRLVVTEFLRN